MSSAEDLDDKEVGSQRVRKLSAMGSSGATCSDRARSPRQAGSSLFKFHDPDKSRVRGSRTDGIKSLHNPSIGFQLDLHGRFPDGRQKHRREPDWDGVASFDGTDEARKIVHVSKLMQVCMRACVSRCSFFLVYDYINIRITTIRMTSNSSGSSKNRLGMQIFLQTPAPQTFISKAKADVFSMLNSRP